MLNPSFWDIHVNPTGEFQTEILYNNYII